MKIHEALDFGRKRLETAGVQSANIDARWLLAEVLGTEPSGLIIAKDEVLSPAQVDRYSMVIAQRERFQPVAQIIGKREFWGRTFKVTTDTLDPRPETETIIARVLDEAPPKRILDLGIGTGCILLTLLCEFPQATGVGTDVSQGAIKIAETNAKTLGVQKRVELLDSDWFTSVHGTFDLIVSNPPYISEREFETLSQDVRNWEPKLALTPGGDGLNPYRIIARELERFLSADGMAVLEFGSSQSRDIVDIFEAENWHNLEILKDMNGHDRILVVSN